jgi:hypothetical protein
MGYLETTVTVDGVDSIIEVFDDGEELEAEQFRAGIIALAKLVANDVEMNTQYHGHDLLDENDPECVCNQYSDGDQSKWSNHDAT